MREAQKQRPDLKMRELQEVVRQRVLQKMHVVYEVHQQEIEAYVDKHCPRCGGSGMEEMPGGGSEWWRASVFSHGDEQGRWKVWDTIIMPKEELPGVEWYWNPWRVFALPFGRHVFFDNGEGDKPVRWENGMALIWANCDIPFIRLGNAMEDSAA